MFRFYFMPIAGAGTFDDPRRPKYADTTMSGFVWGMMDYGFEPFCLVGSDLSTAADASLTANADVLAMPVNLDQNLSAGAVSIAQTKLESANIPAGWLSTSLTYRQALRTIGGAFQFMQRLHGLFGNTRIFGGGVTLDSTVSQIPASARQALSDAADSMGIDKSSATGSTKLRVVLKALSDSWGSRPLNIMGGEI